MTNCIICNSVCPEMPEHSKQRWGIRKYCSSKCIKTAYRLNHPEKDTESKKQWLVDNPEKRAKASSDYRKRNQAYYTEYVSLRTRRAKQAKPKWLDEWQLFYIEELYDLARLRKLEVDHVIPIKHKLVCGLHVPWNLQLLTRSENAKKSNKFNEDVIGVIE